MWNRSELVFDSQDVDSICAVISLRAHAPKSTKDTNHEIRPVSGNRGVRIDSAKRDRVESLRDQTQAETA